MNEYNEDNNINHEEPSPLAVKGRLPLKGLNIVLNSGNGSGGFFCKVLQDLGANVDGSVNTEPDPLFPSGIPNPEKEEMVQETIQACEKANADLGILLDTDS
jgi:phosphomannomutase